MRGLLRLSVKALLIGGSFASLANAATFYTSQPIPINASQLKITSLTNDLRALANNFNPVGGPTIFNWSNGLNDPGQYIGSPSVTMAVYGSAMNASGQIAGYTLGSSEHAVLYSAGQYTDIGADPLLQNSSVAWDLNNQGDMVGWWRDPGGRGNRAFVYSNGTVTQIKPPSEEPASNSISASAINNLGQVTGQYAVGSTGKGQLFIHDNGVTTPITVFSIYGSPWAVDINDAGQVVGSFDSSPKTRDCFIYSNGQVSQLGILGLGSYPFCTVRQLNNSGVVVGHTISNGNPADPPQGAWVYSNGTTAKLDNVISPSDPLAVNGIKLSDAVAINDNGQIVALSYPDASGVSRYYLLTPTESTDTTDYNFETDTQGWQSTGDVALTIATSTTRAYSGGSSLSINRNGIGLGRVAVSAPVATPGQKVTFNLYVPADANIDWIQPFALESGNGTWHGNWTPVEGLQLGHWNTLELYVPADAQPLASLGVEIHTTQAYGGTIYLDSIDAVSVSDTADYSFETDTQGWESNGEPIATVGRSTTHKYVGNASLSVDISNTGFASVRVLNPAAHAGQTVTFNVFLPAGAPIEWIQPFGQGNSGWYGNWVPSEYLQLGAWNTFTVQIPSDAQPLDAIGVEIYVGQPFQGTVYVDSVNF